MWRCLAADKGHSHRLGELCDPSRINAGVQPAAPGRSGQARPGATVAPVPLPAAPRCWEGPAPVRSARVLVPSTPSQLPVAPRAWRLVYKVGHVGQQWRQRLRSTSGHRPSESRRNTGPWCHKGQGPPPQ